MKKFGLFLLASAVSLAVQASPNRPILETESIGENPTELLTRHKIYEQRGYASLCPPYTNYTSLMCVS
jgi:hypothetical protein